MTDDLKALSEAATGGKWRFSPWHVEEADAAVYAEAGWIIANTSNDNNAKLIADLVNAYRSGQLVRATAIEAARAQAIEECAEFCRLHSSEWDHANKRHILRNWSQNIGCAHTGHAYEAAIRALATKGGAE